MNISNYLSSLAKKNGFNVSEYTNIPQFALQAWFRDNHSIIISVIPFTHNNDKRCYCTDLSDNIDTEPNMWSYYIHKDLVFVLDDSDFDSYEDALEEALTQAHSFLK